MRPIPTFFCLLLASCLFSACAIAPVNQHAAQPASLAIHQAHLSSLAHIMQFSLKGRLGIVTQPKGFSGRIDWQHTGTQDAIALYSPFGSKVASINKTPDGVALTTQKGEIIQANDVESLTEKTLGWQLPLAGLSDWALGRPTSSSIDASTWDENGRLTTLTQDGWLIQYADYSANNGGFLPNKITLKHEKISLKLLVEQWSE